MAAEFLHELLKSSGGERQILLVVRLAGAIQEHFSRLIGGNLRLANWLAEPDQAYRQRDEKS